MIKNISRISQKPSTKRNAAAGVCYRKMTSCPFPPDHVLVRMKSLCRSAQVEWENSIARKIRG